MHRFKKISYKHWCVLIKFDICYCYPFIIERLINEAIKLTKQRYCVFDEEVKTIRHYQKSVLVYNEQLWTKNDVALGYFDGSKIREIVSTYHVVLLIHLIFIVQEWWTVNFAKSHSEDKLTRQGKI